MFNFQNARGEDLQVSTDEELGGGNYVVLEQPGSCRFQYCNCSRFVPKSAQDAQFCENCGHSRSMHIH